MIEATDFFVIFAPLRGGFDGRIQMKRLPKCLRLWRP